MIRVLERAERFEDPELDLERIDEASRVLQITIPDELSLAWATVGAPRPKEGALVVDEQFSPEGMLAATAYLRDREHERGAELIAMRFTGVRGQFTCLTPETVAALPQPGAVDTPVRIADYTFPFAEEIEIEDELSLAEWVARRYLSQDDFEALGFSRRAAD